MRNQTQSKQVGIDKQIRPKDKYADKDADKDVDEDADVSKNKMAKMETVKITEKTTTTTKIFTENRQKQTLTKRVGRTKPIAASVRINNIE